MPLFARSFAVDALAEWDARNPGNAVRTLFERWSLPGEKATGEASLRLGLRDGYLNFYVRGQSVAKLARGRNGPRVSVHKAYVAGCRRARAGNCTPRVQGYQAFEERALADPATGALIQCWIDTADSYASAEKCFVDELIAANPGVIDLEMGLPASDEPASERAAPRMDLVVTQRRATEGLSVCFWEAKCANNPELRASGSNPPKVVEQIEKYVGWMAEDGRVAQVQQACRTTAATMLDLHRVFRKGRSSPESVSIWEELAALEAPAVIVRPGIVVGNRWPSAYTPSIGSSPMEQYASSFARNGHRTKLNGASIRVHEVGPDHEGLELPFIAADGLPD